MFTFALQLSNMHGAYRMIVNANVYNKLCHRRLPVKVGGFLC